MTRKSLPLDREIGRRVKVRRLDLGMSQAALAGALGLTFQQVQKYEKGYNRISASRLKQIAEILGVSTAFFYDDGKNDLPEGQAALALLDNTYSLRLMRAFLRIQNRRIQLKTVELIEDIADATGGQAC